MDGEGVRTLLEGVPTEHQRLLRGIRPDLLAKIARTPGGLERFAVGLGKIHARQRSNGSGFETPPEFNPSASRLWEVPEPGSGEAAKRIFAGNRHSASDVGGVADPAPERLFSQAVSDVKSLIDGGHGVRLGYWSSGNGRGGRVEGSAQNPRGLPVVLSTLRDVPAKQPKCGVISADRMAAALRRAELTPTEFEVLRERLGIGRHGYRLTQLALADLRGVSQQAIAKVERKAREKVRAVLEADGFRGFERRLEPNELE